MVFYFILFVQLVFIYIPYPQDPPAEFSSKTCVTKYYDSCSNKSRLNNIS